MNTWCYLNKPGWKASVTAASIATLLLTDGLIAAEYWVRPNLGGDDHRLCLEDSPCKLSADVLALLAAGDQLHLKSGIYSPTLIEGIHGAADAPIVISGPKAHAGQAIFSGQTTDTSTRDLLELKQCSNIIVRDVGMRAAFRSGIRVNNSHNVTLKRINVSSAGKWAVFSNHSNFLSVVDSTLKGPTSQHGIYLSNSGDNATLLNNHISGFAGSGIHVNGDLSMGGAPGVVADGVISNLVIAGNWIDRNGKSGGAAINLDGALNTVISNNLITSPYGAGVALFRGDAARGSNWVDIHNNLIVGAAQSRDLLIFNQSGTDNTVQNNILIVRDASVHAINVHKNEKKNGRSTYGPLPFTSSDNFYWVEGSLIELGNNSLSAPRVANHPLLGLRKLKEHPQISVTENLGYFLSTQLAELVKLKGIGSANSYLNGDRINLPAPGQEDTQTPK
ncbi:right-handed parallel beta-helix repeat-containing protein [Congregibacter sp.]|jgi:hypothetical protein|uniref:right-handed parallel beta-helix repeat-containing protein n=1 Tax=Congregibacter sp. TaxID=2744308 RepID=UPI0039E711F4